MGASIVKQSKSEEYIVFIDIDHDMWIIDKEMIIYIQVMDLDSGHVVYVRNNSPEDIEWIKYYEGLKSYDQAYELMVCHLMDEAQG